MMLGVLTRAVFWLANSFAVNWMRVRATEYIPGIFIAIYMGLPCTTQLFANAIVGATVFLNFFALFAPKIPGKMVEQVKLIIFNW